MSVYKEYKLAETDEEREEALMGMKWEERRDKMAEEMAEREQDD